MWTRWWGSRRAGSSSSPVAYLTGAGFVPVRKVDKLPWETESAEYELEYGTATLEIHRDAVASGERVLIVDDVLATGGTSRATAELVERIGGKVVGIACLIELEFLHGREKLEGHDLYAPALLRPVRVVDSARCLDWGAGPVRVRLRRRLDPGERRAWTRARRSGPSGAAASCRACAR